MRLALARTWIHMISIIKAYEIRFSFFCKKKENEEERPVVNMADQNLVVQIFIFTDLKCCIYVTTYMFMGIRNDSPLYVNLLSSWI